MEGSYSAVLLIGLINTAIDRGETRPLWVANGFNRFSSPGQETVINTGFKPGVNGLAKSVATALKCGVSKKQPSYFWLSSYDGRRRVEDGG